MEFDQILHMHIDNIKLGIVKVQMTKIYISVPLLQL